MDENPIQTPEPTQTPPSSAQLAAKAAFDYLMKLSSTQTVDKVRVEQLEPGADSNVWSVVLSYNVSEELVFDTKREYKEFKVDITTKQVISMTIWAPKA